jgi:hypothetical protein
MVTLDNVNQLESWWEDVDDSPVWQERIFDALAGAYLLIGLVALVQLIRIQLRVPEYGWTTQKVFHLLNFIVNTVRALSFIWRPAVAQLKPQVAGAIVMDLPGLLFFTTYTLLVLFWAEIYHQARSLPTDSLRPAFLITNAAVYAVQLVIWVTMFLEPGLHRTIDMVAKLFFALVSLGAAAGFLLYGGRLFLMLRRFPIESKGRRKKLREVGFVTAICFTCFTIRAVMIAWSAFSKEADLDVLNHPILNAIYYTLTEIVPSALVLYILRKLPPRRTSGQYHAIR